MEKLKSIFKTIVLFVGTLYLFLLFDFIWGDIMFIINELRTEIFKFSLFTSLFLIVHAVAHDKDWW